MRWRLSHDRNPSAWGFRSWKADVETTGWCHDPGKGWVFRERIQDDNGSFAHTMFSVAYCALCILKSHGGCHWNHEICKKKNRTQIFQKSKVETQNETVLNQKSTNYKVCLRSSIPMHNIKNRFKNMDMQMRNC